MRKILLVLAMILALSMFVACSRVTETSDSDLYDIKLIAEEGQVFIDSADIYSIEDEGTVVPISDASEKVLQLGKTQVTAKLKEIKMYRDGSQSELYASPDENVRYSTENSSSFSMSAQNQTFLCAYPYEVLTESNLLEHVKSYISQYVDSNYVKDYSSACYTKVVTVNEGAAWAETKGEFYIPTNGNESVIGYRIEFRKCAGGLLTSDRVSVSCDEHGNIHALSVHESPADWASVAVDQNKVDKSIQFFFTQYVRPDVKVVQYTIQTQQLIYKNGIVGIQVAVEITASIHDEEFVVLCPLVLF